MLLELLDSRGFSAKYDFVYLPCDFARSLILSDMQVLREPCCTLGALGYLTVASCVCAYIYTLCMHVYSRSHASAICCRLRILQVTRSDLLCFEMTRQVQPWLCLCELGGSRGSAGDWRHLLSIQRCELGTCKGSHLGLLKG